MAKPKTDEHKRKISEALRGRTQSEQSRALRSESMKRFWERVRKLQAEAETGGEQGDNA